MIGHENVPHCVGTIVTSVRREPAPEFSLSLLLRPTEVMSERGIENNVSMGRLKRGRERDREIDRCICTTNKKNRLIMSFVVFQIIED